MLLEFKEKLGEIGFSEREARIYLELLQIGPQAVSVIAKRLDMNRSTLYSVMKSLEKKGVIASYRNGKVKYFCANDPNSLIGYIDRKCRTFDYYRSQFIREIPKFRDISDKYNFEKPIVSYFEGTEGLKHVLYDVLETRDVFRSYLPVNKWLEIGMDDFLIEFRKFRIENKKVPLRIIVPNIKKVKDFLKKNEGYLDDLTEILYVSASEFDGIFENGLNIYDDKVSIVHFEKGDEYGVVIQNEKISQMHKVIFDMAWNGFKVKNSEKV